MRKVLVAATALLAACAGGPPGLPLGEAVVRPTSYTAPALPPAGGEAILTVRTFVTEAGAAGELAADCTFETEYSSGAFRSPARVALPDLGAQTPVVRVACAESGLEGAAAARAALRRGYGGVRPTIGISIGTGYGGYGHRDVGVGVGGLWGGYGYGPGYGYGQAGLRAVYPDLAIELE